MAESRVNPQNFYVVQGWMVSDLGLKGNELAVYAIIYGFSQADGEWFSGSLNYLTDWTNLSKQSIINVLKSLVKNDLIEKREQIIHGVKFCSYRSKKLTGGSQKTLPPVVKKVDHGSQKTLTGVVKKVDWGSQKTLPNNITDKIEDTIADTDRETEQSPVLSAANGIASIFCTAFGVFLYSLWCGDNQQTPVNQHGTNLAGGRTGAAYCFHDTQRKEQASKRTGILHSSGLEKAERIRTGATAREHQAGKSTSGTLGTGLAERVPSNDQERKHNQCFG